jgi:hypothetical protein
MLNDVLEWLASLTNRLTLEDALALVGVGLSATIVVLLGVSLICRDPDKGR